MNSYTNANPAIVDVKARSGRPAFLGVGALLLMVLVTQATAGGTSFELQGQSKGSCSWISGNLRGWHDQDFIPCRVLITGRAIQHKTISLNFPRLNGKEPDFQSLLNFRASSNVSITSEPVLSSPTGAVVTCKFTINYTGRGAGYIEFLARLAEGAHLSSSDSLMLSGEPVSMGKLRISQPASNNGPASFDSPHNILRCLTLPGEGFRIAFSGQSNRLYCIQYSNDLKTWRAAQCVIIGNGALTYWTDKGQPETEKAPSTQEMRFYRLFQLAYVLNQNSCHQEPCQRDDDDHHAGHQHDCDHNHGDNDDNDDEDGDDDGDDCDGHGDGDEHD